MITDTGLKIVLWCWAGAVFLIAWLGWRRGAAVAAGTITLVSCVAFVLRRNPGLAPLGIGFVVAIVALAAPWADTPAQARFIRASGVVGLASIVAAGGWLVANVERLRREAADHRFSRGVTATLFFARLRGYDDLDGFRAELESRRLYALRQKDVVAQSPLLMIFDSPDPRDAHRMICLTVAERVEAPSPRPDDLSWLTTPNSTAVVVSTVPPTPSSPASSETPDLEDYDFRIPVSALPLDEHTCSRVKDEWYFDRSLERVGD